MTDNIVEFTKGMPKDEALKVWANTIRTEPWDAGLSDAFLRFVAGEEMKDLTEVDMARHPPMLRFWRQIVRGYQQWQAQRDRSN